eukprot:8031536-Alexandrium_andersonii.AAC.1
MFAESRTRSEHHLLRHDIRLTIRQAARSDQVSQCEPDWRTDPIGFPMGNLSDLRFIAQPPKQVDL